MAKLRTAKDLMVKSPVTVEPHHSVGYVRYLMLSGSYSSIPVRFGDDWYLILDSTIADYQSKQRKPGPAEVKTLKGCKEEGIIDLVPAHTCRPSATESEIVQLLKRHPALLVVDESPPVLLGILTAFDLL
jgi:CBS domain-containing protein